METIEESSLEKTYLCNLCNKTFKRCDNLKKHMAIHGSTRPYKCNICQKSFRSRGHLNAHLLIHTGEKPFKCEVCGKDFNQNSNLKKHLKLHTGHRPYECHVCSQNFTQLCYLKEHEKTHTGERAFACPQCSKCFKNNNNLKSHMMTHNHEKPYQCTICDKFFKYSKNYMIHRIAHENEVICHCEECGKEFRNPKNLKRHMLIHKGVQLYECFVCGREFRKADNLKKHYVIHSGVKPYQCHVCGKDFRSLSNLKSHMVQHSVHHPYSCEICDKKFKYKCNYSRHMKNHTGESPYRCSACDASFNCKTSLDAHRLIHIKQEEISAPQEATIEDITAYSLPVDDELEDIIHNIEAVDMEEKVPLQSVDSYTVLTPSSVENEVIEMETKSPFECHHCGKEYTTKSNLGLHMRNHTGERPFKCDLCSKTFTLNSMLKVHLRSHTNERPYSCIVCSKSFKHSSHLHTHYRGHFHNKYDQQAGDVAISIGENVEEPSNSCHICGKTFVRKYILKRHMLVHSDERAFNCNVCNKKFKENSHLKAHTMLHTGERPFDCDVCGKKFIQKSDQKRHMRTHSKSPSKGRPFTCTVCGLKFLYMHNLDTHKIIHAMRKNKHCGEEGSFDSFHTGNDNGTENFSPEFIDKQEHGHQLHLSDIAEGEKSNFEQTSVEIDPGVWEPPGLIFKTDTSCYGQETLQNQNDGENANLLADPVLKENVIRVYSSRSRLESASDKPNHINMMDKNNDPVQGFDNRTLPTIQLYSISSENNIENSSQIDIKEIPEDQKTNNDKKLIHVKCSSYSDIKHLSQESAVFECLVCGRVYRNINTFKKHMLMHSGLQNSVKSKISKCPTCGKKFNRISNLKRHMGIHTGERPFACHLCSKRFKEKGHLKTHILLVHSDTRPFECNICGKRMALRSDHKRHMRSHSGEKPFSCIMCGSKFATKRTLDTHKIIHAMKKNRQSNPNKIHVIAVKTANEEENPKASMTDVPEQLEFGNSTQFVPGPQKVTEIPSKFKIQTVTTTVFKPIKRNDPSSDDSHKPVVRVFSQHQPNTLDQHPVSGSPPNSMIEKKIAQYRSHIARSYNAELPPKALESVTEVLIGKIKVQAVPYELVEERNKLLQCDRNFPCSECDKRFSTNHNLKIHMRIHTGERPYQCTVCKKTFTQKSNLKIHMKTHR